MSKLNKMYQKPVEPDPVKDIPIADISIPDLINSGLLVLFREMSNLKRLSINGKLGPAEARDLRDTIKLLFELRDREKDLLNTLTDEDLEKLTNDIKARPETGTTD